MGQNNQPPSRAGLQAALDLEVLDAAQPTASPRAAPWPAPPKAWLDVLPFDANKQLHAIAQRIHQTSPGRAIAPADPFRALRLTPPDRVRVILVGQDPYPGAGQADGLSFSAERLAPRPSLRRVAEVLEADRPGWRRPISGRLDAWAERGVLLLNTALTVEVGRPGSHLAVGWQALTMAIIVAALKLSPGWVGLAWGRHAESFFDEALSRTDAASTIKPTILRTRHPANDYQREFMADGSHFAATADRVDWWCIGAGP